MIEVKELTKSYGPVKALDRVSFEAERGRILGFLGPNGAGKSTTLRILTGFLPGDGGSARVAGLDVARDPRAVRARIGYLPEGVPLYPEMRVEELLRLRSRLKGIPRPRRAQAIDRALAQTGTVDVRRRIVGTLSRGYRQRVGLADALLADPEVLILDEPTVGLDPEQVRQVRRLLAEVGAARTVVFSTHILSEVEIVCSDVVIIHKGRIVARDSAASLRARFGGNVRIAVEAAGDQDAILRGLSAIPGMLRVARDAAGPGRYVLEAPRAAAGSPAGDLDARDRIYEAAVRGGWRLRELRVDAVSLEEAFLAALAAEEAS